MVIVSGVPITTVEPVHVFGSFYAAHLHPGAWVRHVSYGPMEGGSTGQYKNTLLTRVTSVNFRTADFATIGEAHEGDSGSPVFQMREDDSGAMREVLVGITKEQRNK
jgi:hypothetical protein